MGSTRATTRRRFFWQAGAALSVPLAAGGEAATGDTAGDEADDRLALRRLNTAVVRAVNAADAQALADLIGDPSGAFEGTTPVRLTTDAEAGPEEIVVAADRRSATARLRLIAETREPIGPRCTLVDMARAQGEGFVRRLEPRMFELGYVRRLGVWKIDRFTSAPVDPV